MSNNFSDAQLAELGDMSLGMIACDYYAWTLENPANNDFIAGVRQALQRARNRPRRPTAHGRA